MSLFITFMKVLATLYKQTKRDGLSTWNFGQDDNGYIASGGTATKTTTLRFKSIDEMRSCYARYTSAKYGFTVTKPQVAPF